MKPCIIDDIIPTIDEVKALSTRKKEDIIKEIVIAIKKASIAGGSYVYKNFPRSSGLNKTLAKEIKQDFTKKGYFVTIFEDTCYRQEGISFTIIWS